MKQLIWTRCQRLYVSGSSFLWISRLHAKLKWRIKFCMAIWLVLFGAKCSLVLVHKNLQEIHVHSHGKPIEKNTYTNQTTRSTRVSISLWKCDLYCRWNIFMHGRVLFKKCNKDITETSKILICISCMTTKTGQQSPQFMGTSQQILTNPWLFCWK